MSVLHENNVIFCNINFEIEALGVLQEKQKKLTTIEEWGETEALDNPSIVHAATTSNMTGRCIFSKYIQWYQR